MMWDYLDFSFFNKVDVFWFVSLLVDVVVDLCIEFNHFLEYFIDDTLLTVP